ncbi:hypothetical protein V1523DRAFT_203177 [Lipomyces doorenjongii]
MVCILGVIFRYTDSMLLDILPFRLKCKFAAVLTHKSEISQQMVASDSCVLHNGMSPTPFRSMHQQLRRERYDMQKLAYLEVIETLRSALSAAEVSMPSPITFFNDNSVIMDLFFRWLSYRGLIIESCSEEMATDVNDSDHYCQIDHSFKATKLICAKDGQHDGPIFVH